MVQESKLEGKPLNVLGVVKSDEYKVVTKEQLIQAFPEKKKTITDELVNMINDSQRDPQFDVLTLYDQMINHKEVMENCNGGLRDYINALKFCSYLEACDDNYTQAYIKTFSHRTAVKSRMFEPSGSKEYKEITSMASQYRKTNMVIAILTISDAPLRLLTRGMQFKALQVLHGEMTSAYHSKDRIAAADKLLVHTRAQEEKGNKLEINLGLTADAKKQSEAIHQQLHDIASNQMMLLQQGASIEDIQKLHLKKDEDIIDLDDED